VALFANRAWRADARFVLDGLAGRWWRGWWGGWMGPHVRLDPGSRRATGHLPPGPARMLTVMDEDVARLSSFVRKHLRVHGTYSFALPTWNPAPSASSATPMPLKRGED
jgi:hypothetical protein